MPATNTCTLADAKAARALVLGFAPKAQIVYDPNFAVPPGSDAGFVDDRISGAAPLVPVSANMKDDVVGTFSLYGEGNQPDLAIPPQVFGTPGVKGSGQKYGLDGSKTFVFCENIGALLAAKGNKGHNQGIKAGDNLVAVGPDLDKDEQLNRQATLYWANQPFNARQEAA